MNNVWVLGWDDFINQVSINITCMSYNANVDTELYL